MDKNYFDLDDIIEKIFPGLPDNWKDLFFQFEETIDKYGYHSQEVVVLYDSIVKQHRPMQDLLDQASLYHFKKED